jgi:hypothetical protein
MIKQRSLLTFVSMFTILVQAACAPAAAGACPTPTTDTKLFTNPDDGYCLLHPSEFTADTPPFILVLHPAGGGGDVLGDAWASIDVESAEGRTAAQVADAQMNSVAGLDFGIERTEATVDGEPAVIVDGLPGPDPWRKVFIVHGDRLYTLTFLPWQPNTDPLDVFQSLEASYETMMRTLHFLPPAKPLPTPTLPWGPDHLPDPIVFEYPLDGQALDYEGDYSFKVLDIPGADGYLWRFSQNGVVVWENLRDEMGLTAGGTYAILQGSVAHSRFVPGPVEVSVQALMAGEQYYSETTTITIILEQP